MQIFHYFSRKFDNEMYATKGDEGSSLLYCRGSFTLVPLSIDPGSCPSCTKKYIRGTPCKTISGGKPSTMFE